MRVEFPDGSVREWPKCLIDGCQNLCCLRLNSPFCWPHSHGYNNATEAEASGVKSLVAARKYPCNCHVAVAVKTLAKIEEAK